MPALTVHVGLAREPLTRGAEDTVFVRGAILRILGLIDWKFCEGLQ